MLFRTVTLVFIIRYHFDGNLFKLRRLQAKNKVQTDVLEELLYADDIGKNASSEAKCKKAWIKSRSYEIAMISQSAQKRQRLSWKTVQ